MSGNGNVFARSTKGKKKNKEPAEREGNAEEKETESDDSPEELKNKGKIFVGGLDLSLTSENLQQYFSRFGKVLDAVVMRHPDSGKSRGFGFVTFANPKDAASAMQAFPHVLNGKQFDLRPFTSGKSVKAQKNERAFKVFLGGLPPELPGETLKKFFERYGQVVDVIVPLNRDTNKPKGFGFVLFKSEDAAEKCLAEKYVHLGGRRVQIRTAGPRSRSQALHGVEFGVECAERDEYLPDLEAMGAVSFMDDKTSSGSSGEISEDSKILKTFQEYFREESELQKEMNEAKTEEESDSFTELEKFLTQYLLNCGNENKTANVGSTTSEDSELEETSSGTEEDFSDSDCDSRGGTDDEVDEEHEADLSSELSKRFREVVRSSLMFHDAEDSGVKSDGKGGGSQVSKFKDSNGSLFCSMCEWSPQDNSFEGFLAHCKTAAHKSKLKERFVKGNFQTAKPAEGNKKAQEIRKEVKKAVPATAAKKVQPPQKQQQEMKQTTNVKEPKAKAVKKETVQSQNAPKKTVAESQNAPKKTVAESQNAPKKTVAESQNAPKKTVAESQNVPKKTVAESQNAPKKTVAENQNATKPVVENKKGKTDSASTEKMTNLKAAALAKGMSCILPHSNNTLKCEMCKKKIPQSADFSILIKNVSSHLQSKKHLQKVVETESLLLEECEKKIEAENQKKNSKKNAAAQGKTPSEVRKAPKQKNIIENVPGPKQKSVEQGTAVKQKAAAKSKQKTSKLLFLCVPCNYFVTDIETFKTHLKSKSHSDCFTNKGLSTDLSFDSLSKCKNCETYLYGSLFYINKHYSKCSEKNV